MKRNREAYAQTDNKINSDKEKKRKIQEKKTNNTQPTNTDKESDTIINDVERFIQISDEQEEKRKLQDLFGYPQQKVSNDIQTNQFIVSKEEESERENTEWRHFFGKELKTYDQDNNQDSTKIIVQNILEFLPLSSIKKLRFSNKYMCCLADEEIKNRIEFIIVGKPNHDPTIKTNNDRRFVLHIKSKKKRTEDQRNHIITFINNMTLNTKGIYIDAGKINAKFLNKILTVYTNSEKCTKLKKVFFQFNKEFIDENNETTIELFSLLRRFFDNSIAPSLTNITIDADVTPTNTISNISNDSYPTYEISTLLELLPPKENTSIEKIKLIAAIPDSSFLKYSIRYLKNLKKLTLKNCNINEIQNESFEKESNEASALKEFKITQLTLDYEDTEFHQFFSLKSLEQFLTLCPKINNIYIDTLILGLNENDFDNFLSYIKKISTKIDHIKISPNITNTLRDMIKNNKAFFENKIETLKKQLESMDLKVSLELNLDDSENDRDLCGGLSITIDKK